MKILFIGDISARPGREVVKKYLEDNRIKYDFVIANCENSAHGEGITDQIAEDLYSYGIDCLTSGNDIWKKKEAFDLLNSENRLIRPLNYPDYYPGKGYTIIEKNNLKFLVLNLIGKTYMTGDILNPFRVIQNWFNEHSSLEYDYSFIDFHAEATSEKLSLGYMLDGRVDFIAGSHTHVQTNDARILPSGRTMYITDAGMSGSLNSVLWVKKEIAIEKNLTPYVFSHFEVEEEKPWIMSGVEFIIDNKARNVNTINFILN